MNMKTLLDYTKKPAYNSTFAIGGISCSADSFGVTESSVLLISICAEKPAHRKSAKRQAVKKPNFNIYLQKNNAKISPRIRQRIST